MDRKLKRLHKLAKKWEKVAENEGVVVFTGAQHLLFANELRAIIDDADGFSLNKDILRYFK